MISKTTIQVGISLVLILSVQISMGQNPPVISNFVNDNIINHMLELKEGISLECEGRGHPEPEYRWFHNNEEVGSDTEGSGNDESIVVGRVFSDDNQKLTFSSAEPRYLGFYHCEATNEHGTAKSEVISVLDKPVDGLYPDPEGYTVPEFTDGGPKPQLAPFEQQATLHCVASGDPTPDIIWTRDGKVINPIYEINHPGQITLGQPGNSLTVNSVNEKTVGTYACNATNRAGYVYKSVPVNILQASPTFVEKPITRTVSVGMKGILRCGVQGYPKPTVSWKHNGKDVNLNTDGKIITGTQKYETMADGGLTINKIDKDDAGSFTCTAVNSEGEISGK